MIGNWIIHRGGDKTDMNLRLMLQIVTFKKCKKFLKDASKRVKYVWLFAKFNSVGSLPRQPRISKLFTERAWIGA